MYMHMHVLSRHRRVAVFFLSKNKFLTVETGLTGPSPTVTHTQIDDQVVEITPPILQVVNRVGRQSRTASSAWNSNTVDPTQPYPRCGRSGYFSCPDRKKNAIDLQNKQQTMTPLLALI